MTILLLLALLLLSISPRVSDSVEPDPLSHDRLLPWKGFCVLLILLSHYTGYIQTDPYDEPYLLVRSGMRQTIVVLFFFAAGYGMVQQLITRGRPYLLRVLKKALRLWLVCALSALCMLVIQSLRGRSYDLTTILMAFIPLVSLGNSPWFIFAMVLCYLFFVLSALPYALRPGRVTLFLLFLFQSVLTALYMMALSSMGFDDFWYDSVLLFPIGLLFGILHLRLSRRFSCSTLSWLILLTGSVISVCYLYCYQTRSFLLHELYLVSACGLLLVLALRWTPGSRLLLFLGQHALVIYLFQRIPMILFYETGLLDMVPHLGFFPVFSSVCLIAALSRQLRKKPR